MSKQKDLTKKYFSELSKDYNGKWYKKRYTLDTRDKRVAEMIDEKGKKILEIGCGIGVLADMLQKKGNSVCACDISQEMINEAKKLNPNIDFSIQDIESLTYKDNSFDYVVTIGVLEYLDYDDKALKEIFRVLKKGGYAIIEFNNKLWHLKMNDYKEPNEEFPMKRRNHNPFTTREELKKHGFILKDLCFYHLDGEQEDKCRSWEAPYLACAFISKARKE